MLVPCAGTRKSADMEKGLVPYVGIRKSTDIEKWLVPCADAALVPSRGGDIASSKIRLAEEIPESKGLRFTILDA